MSACISRAGEFSSHIYSGLTIPESFTCARCAVLAEDEIFEALVAALARVEELETANEKLRAALASVGSVDSAETFTEATADFRLDAP